MTKPRLRHPQVPLTRGGSIRQLNRGWGRFQVPLGKVVFPLLSRLAGPGVASCVPVPGGFYSRDGRALPPQKGGMTW